MDCDSTGAPPPQVRSDCHYATFCYLRHIASLSDRKDNHIWLVDCAQLNPVRESERFAHPVSHTLKGAGWTHTLLSDCRLDLPRQAARMLRTTIRSAVPKRLNDFPDDLLQRRNRRCKHSDKPVLQMHQGPKPESG